MYYSVKELRDKLIERVIGLGVDKSFLENPAFASAISQIDNLIGQMNMFEAAEAVTVKEENGNISFDWTSPVGDKYSMSISSSSPETFRCVRTEEKKSFIDTNGQSIKRKNVVEEVATIDKSGSITLTTNSSIVDNIDCRIGKCNNYTWSEKKCYTSNGVMRDREYKSFARGELSVDFDRAEIDSMLFIPRQAFDFGVWHDKYESRTLLVRDKLDTAKIISEDRTKGIKYSAITPLNQEHGLRDMAALLDGYGPYPQNVVIPPLSQEEIEVMIQRESNPKVAEGLREYAVGRNTYSYNSAEDKHFISEGISQSQGISR
jgi:hypothetical protein